MRAFCAHVRARGRAHLRMWVWGVNVRARVSGRVSVMHVHVCHISCSCMRLASISLAGRERRVGGLPCDVCVDCGRHGRAEGRLLSAFLALWASLCLRVSSLRWKLSLNTGDSLDFKKNIIFIIL